MKKPRTLKKLLSIYDYSRARLMRKSTDKARNFWRDQVNRLKYLDKPFYRETTSKNLTF
jgi:hypothetical protein